MKKLTYEEKDHLIKALQYYHHQLKKMTKDEYFELLLKITMLKEDKAIDNHNKL